MSKKVYVAVDFDGTIVKHTFPEIGEPVPGAIEFLIKLQHEGHYIILNTMRGSIQDSDRDNSATEFNDFLYPAVKYCEENGIKLNGVNNNPTQYAWTNSPKVYGHFYIDDAAIGCPLIYPENGDRPYVDLGQGRKNIQRKIY